MLNTTVKYDTRILKKVAKRSDCLDLYDMSLFAIDIEKSQFVERELRLYQKGIGWMLGIYTEKPDGFDDERFARAYDAIQTWYRLYKGRL